MTIARRKSPAPIGAGRKPAESTVIAQVPAGTVRMAYLPELPAIKVSIDRPAPANPAKVSRRRLREVESATALAVGDIVSWRPMRREFGVLPVGEIRAIEAPSSTVWITTYDIGGDANEIRTVVIFRRLAEIGIASREELAAFAEFRSQFGLALATAEKVRRR